MEHLQFYHDQLNRRTYAIQVSFDKEDLLECLTMYDRPIIMLVGIAKVNPDDMYCKETGRKISTTKLEKKILHVCHCHVDETDQNKIRITLKDKPNDLFYTFRINKKSEKIHFLSVSSW